MFIAPSKGTFKALGVDVAGDVKDLHILIDCADISKVASFEEVRIVLRKEEQSSPLAVILKEKEQTRALQNPRLLRISFHKFRHWKATMLYHQTKDPYYVQHFLGHKKLESTEIYINIEHTLFEAGANDEFTVKVAEKPEEIKALLEVGFEYVLQKDNLIFLRKRR